MSNFKTLTTIVIATLLAAPAFAQDAEPGMVFEKSPDTAASNFASADLDQDGSLNADEFVTFAVMRAEDGDEAFKDIVMGGEYAAAFAAHDANASGGIEITEMAKHSNLQPGLEVPKLEKPDLEMPNLEIAQPDN